MPWTMDDYPQSWKNFEKLKRKKAIDIGNAMLKDGYKEEDTIPIATEQAESWYKDASKKELPKSGEVVKDITWISAIISICSIPVLLRSRKRQS